MLSVFVIVINWSEEMKEWLIDLVEVTIENGFTLFSLKEVAYQFVDFHQL